MPNHTRALSLLAVGALLLGAASASATLHLRLTDSSPSEDAELQEPPEQIRLWFSQQPELAISRIALSGPDGEVDLGEVQAGEDDVLYASVEGTMSDGTYEVAWQTASGDGHPIRGTFSFSVAPGAR